MSPRAAAQEQVHGAWMAAELERHGYRISPGTLYPTLHRREAEGLLTSSRAISTGGIERMDPPWASMNGPRGRAPGQAARTPRGDSSGPSYKRIGDRLLELAEDVVYGGIAIALTVTALVLLVSAAGELVALVRQSGQQQAIAVLDTLLLVFIVVELLFAVRTTLTRRELVAEPFLLVGIIASIKEIVVLSVKAADDAGKGQAFTDQLTEVGVLGALVLGLGVTAWLLRLKEREPAEGDTPEEQRA